MNYYNEFDPHAAAWLCELINAQLIPSGHVDTRSITEVTPSDLKGYTQCHFFAGIGGWSLALQLAGWPSDRPVWTASCPCQPFSSAGKQKGETDARHLWPVFRELVAKCGPPIAFGEQVASKLGRGWLAGVRNDLETLGYRVGAADLCASGAGAPHIRQRLYWGAHLRLANVQQQQGLEGFGRYVNDRGEPGREHPDTSGSASEGGEAGGVGDSRCQRDEFGRGSGYVGCSAVEEQIEVSEWERGRHAATSPGPYGPRFWSEFDLVWCRDKAFRRIESGTFPLVAGVPKGMVRSIDPSASINPQATPEARVMRLKGYGNAIVPPLAASFIISFVEALWP